MRRLLLAVAFLLVALPAQAANCFWVGGTGNTNDPTHWASASGGTASTCAGPGGVPGSADSATWDASSGGGTVTVNNTSPWAVLSLTMGAFTGTWDNSVNNVNITLTGSGNALSISGTGTRNIKLGSATYTLTGTVPTFTASTGTGLTLTAASSTIKFSNSAAGTKTFTGGSQTFGTVVFDGSAGIASLTSSTNVIGTLTINAPNYVQFPTASTMAVTTLNVNGTKTSQAILQGAGSAATVAVTNATMTYAGFWSMVFTGSPVASNSYDFGGNSGITINPPSGGGGFIIGQ